MNAPTNVFPRDILKLRDVESSLGTPVALQLPYDPFLYLKAANEGNPVVTGNPSGAAATALRGIARGLATRSRSLAGRSLGLTPAGRGTPSTCS